MTLSERIYNYYGGLDDEEKAFVDGIENRYSEEEKEKLFKEITTRRNKRLGAPDVYLLESVFKAQKPKNSRRYFWSVCNHCKTEYWYTLPFCPTCWDNGYRNSEHTVRVSDEKPYDKVVRYNKDYTQCVEMGGTPDEKICYDCEHRNFGACGGFGKSDFNCTNFRECPCKQCCVERKRKNETFNRMAQEKNVLNLIPILRAEVGENIG